VIIGSHSHKRIHTVVAVDDVGRRVDEKTVATTSEGHLLLVQWAAQWPEVTFALEDCRHLTRRLKRDLLSAVHRIVRVSTWFMAGARRGGRQPGKSDPKSLRPWRWPHSSSRPARGCAGRSGKLGLRRWSTASSTTPTS
jgi:transposase